MEETGKVHEKEDEENEEEKEEKVEEEKTTAHAIHAVINIPYRVAAFTDWIWFMLSVVVLMHYISVRRSDISD